MCFFQACPNFHTHNTILCLIFCVETCEWNCQKRNVILWWDRTHSQKLTLGHNYHDHGPTHPVNSSFLTIPKLDNFSQFRSNYSWKWMHACYWCSLLVFTWSILLSLNFYLFGKSNIYHAPLKGNMFSNVSVFCRARDDG